MPDIINEKNDLFTKKLAVAPLKLLIMPSIKELGDQVDRYLVSFRKKRFPDGINDPEHQGYVADSYETKVDLPRFGSGEGKAVLGESIRGKDLYILTDVINYSMTYDMNGFKNRYSPDDHYQDLKRVIAAVAGKAHRITVVMPFMYESRQHKRTARESLDCAMMIEELSDMGVSDLMTFDAHDPSVQAAAPLCGFDNFTPFYQFLRALLKSEDDLMIDAEHVVVISPDEGALNRAIYFASVLGVDTGMFYKRRDYAHIVDGKNPIVAHEFLGDSVEGKDVIIVDDMISTGGSMIDTARQLKDMNANRVFICCPFGLFTEGLEMFDDAYEKGYFDRIITTNLHYRRPELLKKEWYTEADMSKLIAQIIDFSNHDMSMDKVGTPTEKIREILSIYNDHVDKEV